MNHKHYVHLGINASRSQYEREMTQGECIKALIWKGCARVSICIWLGTQVSGCSQESIQTCQGESGKTDSGLHSETKYSSALQKLQSLCCCTTVPLMLL